MSSPNRSRLIIDTSGPWRLYQPNVQPGWHVLGTVQRGMEIGALARNQRTGRYVMLRAGAATMLDDRKVDAALPRLNPLGFGAGF